MKKIKENNSWQSIYEQLQDFLNKCIELWRLSKIFDKWVFVLDDWVYRNQWRVPMFSFHELFSIDSWIMEFVEWKPLTKASSIQLKILYEYWLKDYNYLMMSLLTVEEKIQHFLSHATIPTKSEK